MSKCGRPKERNDGGGVKSIIIIDPPLPDHFSLVVAGSRGVKPASRKFYPPASLALKKSHKGARQIRFRGPELTSDAAIDATCYMSCMLYACVYVHAENPEFSGICLAVASTAGDRKRYLYSNKFAQILANNK